MAPQAAKLARQPATREFKFQTGHDQFGRVLRTDVFVPQIQDSWPLAEYTYDLDGNPSREVVNSVIGTRTWGYRGNGWSEPTSYVQDRASGTGDLTQTMSWRPDGRLGSSVYNPGTIGAGGPPASSNYAGTFEYDPAGQLTSVGVTGTGYSSSTTYTYDPMGHRLKEVGSTTAGGSTTSATTYFKWFSDRDGLQYTGPSPSVAARSFSWGFGGSLQGVTDQTTSSASESISYDARGLPREYRTGASDTLAATRSYDGDGRLSRLAVAGGTTYDFSWDPTLDVPQVLEVFTGENTWTRLAYGNERVGFECLNNSVSVGFGQYGYDVSGSAVHTSTASAPAGYGPFGAPSSPPAGDMFFGYRGELHIGGRVHLRNRDYDPALGMFTSPDPVEGQPGTPTANAAYPYANNDPTNNTDPLGLWAEPQQLVAGAQQLLQGGVALAGGVAAGALATDAATAGTAAGCVVFGVGCLTAIGVGLIVAGVVLGAYLVYNRTRTAVVPNSQATAAPVTNPRSPSTTDVPVGPRVTVDDREQCDPPPGYIDKHGRLRRRSGSCEAHHIIQNRTMFEADGRTKIYPRYTTYSAPAIVLTRQSHLEANGVQNGSLLGGTYGDEVEVAVDALRAAQMSVRIPEAISRANAYFMDVVGLRDEGGYDSRTFRPLNRP